MPRETEKIIKGKIAETITEELFKELNFFVIKLGKEYTVNPITQMEEFITACGGEFKLKELSWEIKEITHINVLPDFVIVSPQGTTALLETKFRNNAELRKDDLVFKAYPEAHMLIINTEVSDNIPEVNAKNKNEKEALKNSRFHIWTRRKNSNNDKILKDVVSLTDWLKKDFNIELNNVKLITEKYSDLLNKYFK